MKALYLSILLALNAKLNSIQISQAVAVSVTLEKEITLYIPPSFALRSEHLNFLHGQLPSPFFLLGDFNGHNVLWGSKDNDPRGELIENFITKNDICLMNDKFSRLIQHQHEVIFSFNTPTFRHSASSGCSKQ